MLELCGLSLLTITFALGPPTVAGVTTTQFGTFAVILGFVLLHERPKPNQWVGIVCTIAGVSLLAARRLRRRAPARSSRRLRARSPGVRHPVDLSDLPGTRPRTRG